MTKIVFCEDEKRIQKLILAMLDDSPHQIFMASDGIEGLALIKREHPDLVFADISMPNCDGFQLIDALKIDPGLATIPVVFLTAFAQRAEKDEAYRHGASGYLAKPFTVADLQEQIETFIS